MKTHSPSGWKSVHSAINIVFGEVEDWLVADREGFAQFFKFNPNLLPQYYNAAEVSPAFPYKTSLYLLREVVPKSKEKLIRENLVSNTNNRKPAIYNDYVLPFVEIWNIDIARTTSLSLDRTIKRVQKITQEPF